MSGSNPNAPAYDTGLFDPNIHDNQIVALYDTDADAQMARDKLVAAGVDPSAVQVVDRSADRMAGGVDYEAGDQGIWGAIKSLFVPDDEAHAYNHAIGRGHAMVVVTPTGNSDRHQIIEVLESTDPIDFDAKLEEWRQAGYDYSGKAGSPDERNTARAMPADYAVNATTVTDNIPPSTGHPAGSHDTVGNTVERGVEKAGAAVSGAAAAVGGALGLTDNDRATDRTSAPMPAAPVRGAAAPATGVAGNDETIRIVEERLRVGKREVARGAVRVRSYVVERPVEEQVRLQEENVTIERRPVDRAATNADGSAFQDRTIEMTTRSEEPVVSKEARVVEEVAIHKDATDRVETVRDTVRRTEVDVDDTRNTDKTSPGGSKAGTATDADGAGVGTGMPAGAAAVKGADPKSTGGATTSPTAGATTSGTNAPRK